MKLLMQILSILIHKELQEVEGFASDNLNWVPKTRIQEAEYPNMPQDHSIYYQF